jgi:hypothetical protein
LDDPNRIKGIVGISEISGASACVLKEARKHGGFKSFLHSFFSPDDHGDGARLKIKTPPAGKPPPPLPS